MTEKIDEIKQEEPENKIQKHPGYVEITDNILFVLKEIAKGNTSPSEIALALKKSGIEWSRSKLMNSYSSAMTIINDDVQAMKGAIDQRFILLKKVKEIQQTTWDDIAHMNDVKNTAIQKLDAGSEVDDLKYEEKMILGISPEKLLATITKAKSTILQAINTESEILGYKTDKTIILQSTDKDQQKMLDQLNEQLKRQFKTIYDKEIIDAEVTENENREN